MRAWDLAVLVILIEMSIGFLAGLDFYTDKAGADISTLHADKGYVTKYQKNITDENYMDTSLGIGDYFKFGLDWIFASWNMFVMVVTAFVAISFILFRDFHLPIQICMFVQGIVYLIYTWGFIQWRSGRGGQAFE